MKKYLHPPLTIFNLKDNFTSFLLRELQNKYMQIFLLSANSHVSL